MKNIDKVFVIILLFYVPLILLAGIAGVYSHFYGGILVTIIIILKNKITNFMRGSEYRGYILFVVLFDFVWETLFYIGGFRLLPISYIEIILINLIWWFLMGTIFYFLAEKFDYNPIKALIIPAILGVLIENILRLGMYPLEVSIALMIINGLNYSVELGFAYWFVKDDYNGKANVLHYIPSIVILYLIFWAYYLIISNIYSTEIFFWNLQETWKNFLKL